MTRYVALVDGKPGSYGLTVPDLPGCTSTAATTDEVLRRATEAVRLWAEDELADREKLPEPRSIEALRADPEVAAALAKGVALAIVPLVLDAGRRAKAKLSRDAGLFAAIDEAVAACGLTRLGLLGERCARGIPILGSCARARHGGDHDVYKHTTRPGRIILPRHRTLSPGVGRAITKQARWVE
jgi:predicted RNase H-like HicB family nuclease